MKISFLTIPENPVDVFVVIFPDPSRLQGFSLCPRHGLGLHVGPSRWFSYIK